MRGKRSHMLTVTAWAVAAVITLGGAGSLAAQPAGYDLAAPHLRPCYDTGTSGENLKPLAEYAAPEYLDGAPLAQGSQPSKQGIRAVAPGFSAFMVPGEG
ncbi:MAG: hypothetical protein HQL37_15845, partial [Alphaproteobacteria bacterium]|nr:hypothetical protein [Alphaproteobacteria bacterium]